MTLHVTRLGVDATTGGDSVERYKAFEQLCEL